MAQTNMSRIAQEIARHKDMLELNQQNQRDNLKEIERLEKELLHYVHGEYYEFYRLKNDRTFNQLIDYSHLFRNNTEPFRKERAVEKRD